VVNFTHQPLYPQERTLIPIKQEVGWAPELVWTREKSLDPARIQTPDCPVCSAFITPTTLSQLQVNIMNTLNVVNRNVLRNTFVKLLPVTLDAVKNYILILHIFDKNEALNLEHTLLLYFQTPYLVLF
jgi:hypothetical protein